MPWLVKEGKVLASVELARSRRQRVHRADGDESLTGVLLIEPARSAHTLRSDRPIDIAFLGPPGSGTRISPNDADPLSAPAEGGGSSSMAKSVSKDVLSRARRVGRAFSGATNRGDQPDGGGFEDTEYEVLRVATLGPKRLVKPELRAVAAIEAEAGSLERLGLTSGDRVSIELRQ